MKKGWLIYKKKDLERNVFSVEKFIEKCRQAGIDLEVVTHEDLTVVLSRVEGLGFYAGKTGGEDAERTADLRDREPVFSHPDFIINRSRDYELSKLAEFAGLKVFNSSGITLVGNNKLLATQLANTAGLKTMRTYSSRWKPEYFPLIAKTKAGHGGTEVFWVETERRAALLYEKYGESLLWQEVAREGNRDMRVYVVGQEIYCAMLRHSATDFRSNYSLGGDTERVDPPPAVREQVYHLLKALGEVGYVGIDFIQNGSDWVFNEIEDVVGARMVYTFTSLDPIHSYVEYIADSL